ncbi:MAG: hypothetical protein IJC25_01150 [Clostridia bacterium]|nr:hypothetical protein [Clostridia bacterium]
MPQSIRFFAASNTAQGFVSLFERLYDTDPGQRVFLIAGGPGTGKSSLMRRIAARLEHEEIPFEYLHCSSDPDSLDGVLCHEKKSLILDATPPHTVSPKLAGVIENTVDVGQHWNTALLREKSAQILALSGEIKKRYAEVYKMLNTAGRFKSYTNDMGLMALDEKKCSAYAKRTAKRLIPQGQEAAAPGKELPRFLSNVTPRGHVFFEETLHALADRVYLYRDDFGPAARCVLTAVRQAALKAGYDCYCCYCPLAPEQCEHLIIPALGLALSTVNTVHAARGRCIDLNRYYDAALTQANKGQLSGYRRRIDAAIASSVAQLKSIKSRHESLEQLYGKAMDFTAVDRTAAKAEADFFEN